MKKLSELLRPFDERFEEIDVAGLELNFNHYLEIHKGNENCVYGFYWLMSHNATGHAHIVLRPHVGTRLEDWHVAFYNDERGTAETFASSIRTWFPAYFIRQVDAWYPVYLRRGTEISWVRETFESWHENAERIVAHGRKFLADFDALYDDFLKMIAKKNVWNRAEWFTRVEPDSFLTEYFNLLEKNASHTEWKEYIFKYPFFNRPLFERLKTADGQKIALDTDLCLEFWNRAFICDLPSHEILPTVVKTLVKNKSAADSPFCDLIEKIHKDLKHNKFGEFEAAEGFFETGVFFEETNEFAKAINCFENSIRLNRAENGEYHEEAYEHILVCAEKLANKDYSAYLEETKN